MLASFKTQCKQVKQFVHSVFLYYQMHFLITHKGKELLVPLLIPSWKSPPDSLVETVRYYSDCQMDYLQWKFSG